MMNKEMQKNNKIDTAILQHNTKPASLTFLYTGEQTAICKKITQLTSYAH